MKFISVVSIIIAVLLSFYYFKTKSGLLERKYLLDQNWEKVNIAATNRLNTLTTFLDKAQNVELNRLSSIVDRGLMSYDNYSSECSLEFMQKEYELNKELLRLMKLNFEVENEVIFKKENFKMNSLVETYNSSAKDFNWYYLFPKSIIARKLNLQRVKYFELKYGQNNLDPTEEFEKLQEWIRTGN